MPKLGVCFFGIPKLLYLALGMPKRWYAKTQVLYYLYYLYAKTQVFYYLYAKCRYAKTQTSAYCYAKNSPAWFQV